MGAGNPRRKEVSGERLTIYVLKGGLVPFFPSLLTFPEGKEKEKEREGRFPERKVSALSS